MINSFEDIAMYSIIYVFNKEYMFEESHEEFIYLLDPRVNHESRFLLQSKYFKFLSMIENDKQVLDEIKYLYKESDEYKIMKIFTETQVITLLN